MLFGVGALAAILTGHPSSGSNVAQHQTATTEGSNVSSNTTGSDQPLRAVLSNKPNVKEWLEQARNQRLSESEMVAVAALDGVQKYLRYTLYRQTFLYSLLTFVAPPLQKLFPTLSPKEIRLSFNPKDTRPPDAQTDNNETSGSHKSEENLTAIPFGELYPKVDRAGEGYVITLWQDPSRRVEDGYSAIATICIDKNAHQDWQVSALLLWGNKGSPQQRASFILRDTNPKQRQQYPEIKMEGTP